MSRRDSQHEELPITIASTAVSAKIGELSVLEESLSTIREELRSKENGRDAQISKIEGRWARKIGPIAAQQQSVATAREQSHAEANALIRLEFEQGRIGSDEFVYLHGGLNGLFSSYLDKETAARDLDVYRRLEAGQTLLTRHYMAHDHLTIGYTGGTLSAKPQVNLDGRNVDWMPKDAQRSRANVFLNLDFVDGRNITDVWLPRETYIGDEVDEQVRHFCAGDTRPERGAHWLYAHDARAKFTLSIIDGLKYLELELPELQALRQNCEAVIK